MEITIYVLVLGYVSALYPTVASFRKLRMKFSESSLALSLCMTLYSIAFLSGVIVRTGNIGKTDSLAMHEINAMVAQAGYLPETFTKLVIVLTIGLIFLNLLIGFIIHKTQRPIIYSFALVIIILALLSLPATLVTGTNPFVNFFMECCGIMAYFAWMLDLTYKQFCVIGNIYLQAGICLFSAITPLVLCLRSRKSLVVTSISILNTLLHAILFYIISIHYWMPLDKGFDLCFRELNQLAAYTGTSYVFVNIVIFVIMFVGDLVFNSLLYNKIK